MLGQPFLNSVKFSQEYKPDGIFCTIMHFQTQQLVIFQTLVFQDPTNQTETQIFFFVFQLDLGYIRSLQDVSIFILKFWSDI